MLLYLSIVHTSYYRTLDDPHWHDAMEDESDTLFKTTYGLFYFSLLVPI